jgi:glycosyltransferase involved in cell wall biosynthesis
MERRLRILLITSHQRYKINVRTYPLAKFLSERGHDITLIITADQRRFGIIEDDWDGVRTIECPDLLWGRLRQGWDPWNALNKTIYLMTDTSPYVLIHCLETRPASIHPALTFKHHKRIPMITDWIDWWGRGGIIDELRPAWYRLLFGRVETYYEEAFRTRVEGLTVISTALAARAINLGVDPERICYLPNGSWVELFNVPDRDECRHEVGLKFKGPVIGFSSLDSHLDLTIIMEALAKVTRVYPNTKLMITGTPNRNVSEYAKKYGVQGSLYLTGFLPYKKLPWYLGCADLFVLPFPDKIYNIGRWPSKINGYMSVGRPTVTNPVGDIKTLFEHHEIGLLADWDPSDFAQKIIYLIEHPEIAKRLGRSARTVSTTKFSWNVLIRRLESFYFSILDRQKKGSDVQVSRMKQMK